MIEVVKKKLKLKNLAPNLKIVQFSDLHICKKNLGLLELCIEKINSLKADLLIFTGDAICSGVDYLRELETYLKKTQSSLGKFYCLGNHDYSDGFNSQKVKECLKKSDFELLKNESKFLRFKTHGFFVSGLDDLEKGEPQIKKSALEIGDCGSIWAVHNPINFEKISSCAASLVLSGHTHGGQIRLPFTDKIYKRYLNSPYLSGIYRHGESFLYVNRGIGDAVFHFKFAGHKISLKSPRINSTPEITFIETQ